MSILAAALAVATVLISPAAGQSSQAATPGQTLQSGRVTAQTPSPPRMPRAGELPPKGTARIHGQVVAAETGTPIRWAQVRATSLETRAGGVTSTDAEGLFEIKDLPAGRYTVVATKGGFVSIEFGQRRPGEQGTPLELSDAQLANKVNFALPRGGVIAGQITDDNGDPAPGISVSALRYTFMGGTRSLVPPGVEGSTDVTDDQGTFRLYGLPSGSYIVSAAHRTWSSSEAGVSNTEANGYAPTYFPGTSNLAEATAVSIRAGQQQTGTNFSLIITRLSRIRGRALNSRGEPVARATIMMMPANPTVMLLSLGPKNAQAGADGSFQIPSVAPGRYTLSIRPMGQSSPSDEFGRLLLIVDSDIDDLVITTSPGTIARGTVVTDDGSIPELRADQVQVVASPAEPMMMPAGNSIGRMNEDFTFEIASVFDRRLIRPSVPFTTGWYVKAVYHDGVDVTDTGVDFSSYTAVDDLRIVLTQKTTELSGLVLDARGRPIPDATVIVFPDSRERWSQLSTRYVRSTRPDTDGRYRIRSLPPERSYLVIAVRGLQEGQAGDPEFLARAREDAKVFSLGEGEIKALDVRLSVLQP